MFALVDCNNFYASCEEVFNPKLARRPLIILSNNDGCVIARSKKAKELGIQMGEPAYLYQEKVRSGEIEMLSSNFTLYADMSQRVMQTLESFSPHMEIYSIDEAFFEMDEIKINEARAIRDKVKKWTGIPVSIGMAPTKTLAKLANEIAKKEDGVVALIEKDKIRSVLEKTAPEDIWGIGHQLAKRLKSKRIYTSAQLLDSDDGAIKKLLGVTGYRTVLELRSIPCLELEAKEKRKSIVCSRSFREGLENIGDLSEAVSAFASRAAEKLRQQKSRAAFLSVFIATSPFRQPYEARSCHVEIPVATAYTPEFIRIAKEGLGRIYRKGFIYKKAGVLLGDFCDEDFLQQDLLSKMKSQKNEELMHSIDAINRRYDKKAVQFAAEGIEKRYQSARRRVSPRFTTSWNELLTI